MPANPSTILKIAFLFVVLACAAAATEAVSTQIMQWRIHTLMPPPAKKPFDDMEDHSSDNYYAVREAALYGMAVGFPLLVIMAGCASIGAIFLGVSLVQWRATTTSAWFWITIFLLTGFLCWFLPKLMRIFAK